MRASSIPASEYVPTADSIIIMRCGSWADFEKQLEIRGDTSGPRISYLNGALELMSPSKDHERIGRLIGTLLNVYCLDTGIEIGSYGSWTLKERLSNAGAEPDECFIIGPDQGKDRPDLVIEVVWTHGRLDKLEVYRRLNIAEVWMWISEEVQIYVLRGGRYRRSHQSSLFPALDVELLASCLDRSTLTQAVQAFRQRLSDSLSSARPPRRRPRR